MVVLILALQVPVVRTELCEILKLHYHGFSSTLMFGLLPFIFRFQTKRRKQGESGPTTRVSDSSLCSSEGAIMESEDSDGSYSTRASSRLVEDDDDDDLLDEWGHFTDFDESFQEEDVLLISSVNPQKGLSTLPEEEIMDEEEEE